MRRSDSSAQVLQRAVCQALCVHVWLEQGHRSTAHGQLCIFTVDVPAQAAASESMFHSWVETQVAAGRLTFDVKCYSPPPLLSAQY